MKKERKILSTRNVLIGFVLVIVLLSAFNYFYPLFSEGNYILNGDYNEGSLYQAKPSSSSDPPPASNPCEKAGLHCGPCDKCVEGVSGPECAEKFEADNPLCKGPVCGSGQCSPCEQCVKGGLFSSDHCEAIFPGKSCGNGAGVCDNNLVCRPIVPCNGKTCGVCQQCVDDGNGNPTCLNDLKENQYCQEKPYKSYCSNTFTCSICPNGCPKCTVCIEITSIRLGKKVKTSGCRAIPGCNPGSD